MSKPYKRTNVALSPDTHRRLLSAVLKLKQKSLAAGLDPNEYSIMKAVSQGLELWLDENKLKE